MHRSAHVLRHVVAACAMATFASFPAAAADLSLAGKTIGVAVVGTQHFWDREAYNGATKRSRRLAAPSSASMAGVTIRFMPTTTTSCLRARSTR